MKEFTMDDFNPKDNPTMTAGGCYQRALFDSKPSWDLNYSDILTNLIQLAGRFVEHYASDLFILWDSFDPKKQPEYYIGETKLFGFRESGVDHNENVIRNYNDNHHYYRKIAAVESVIEGSKITLYYKVFNI